MKIFMKIINLICMIWWLALALNMIWRIFPDLNYDFNYFGACIISSMFFANNFLQEE